MSGPVDRCSEGWACPDSFRCESGTRVCTNQQHHNAPAPRDWTLDDARAAHKAQSFGEISESFLPPAQPAVEVAIFRNVRKP